MKATIAVLDKGGDYTKLSVYEKQKCKRLGDFTIFFDGNIYSPTSGVSGSQILAEWLKKVDHLKAGETFLQDVEGDFVFIIAEPERIIAGRDKLGVQPLYYGETERFIALGSNRKALWNLGMEETRSFPPNHLGVFNREGYEFKPVKPLVYSRSKHVDMEEAAKTLQDLLEQSVRKRISGIEDVAIAFSGGIDSSIVAFLVKKYKVNVQLIHVSLENQPEKEEAKKAADALDLPLQVCLFKEEDVERIVSKVAELIETPDPMNVSIGLPFYWVAEKTADLGFKVLMAGQGADELFGGYQRYVKEYLLHDAEKVRKIMFDDVAGLHASNLERDAKICSFHNVELRLPFCSYQIADFAVALPVELKIEKRADTLRKLVLRKTAENMGLPESVIEKPKKAVQYSTGITNVLKRIAKRKKMNLTDYLRKLL